jgi:N6-L-threonylcarbamoyladenine synthase
MLILGIESSCDETGAAVIKASNKSGNVFLLSNVVATSLSMHSKTGGIIPENAAREQVKFIIPVIQEALKKAKIKPQELDAIAVTFGPGLIGSLLVGVETAKTLSYIWNKPLIPTNHLYGHLYANWIDNNPKLPAIGLIVSGGHTDLVLIKKHGQIEWLGGTRDDASGEALDKIGRLLGLPYPGGPYIEKAAKNGDPSRFNFPTPLNDKTFDFSFSGLKTAVLREVKDKNLDEQMVNDICANVQNVIIGILDKKTLRAASTYGVKSILLGGGVAANQTLRESLQLSIVNNQLSLKLFVPERFLCTDNAAMIAAAAFYNDNTVNWRKVDADPGLYF